MSCRPTFAHGPAVDHHDVGREVVGAAQQRRADAVGVDGHAGLLEGADARRVEAAGDDDAARRGSPPRRARSRTSRTSSGATPVGASSPMRAHERRVGEPVGRVEPHAPQRGPSARATSSAVGTESFSKSTSTVTFIVAA